MKIVKAFPPNYDELKKKFPITGKTVFFAFGDVVYSPTGEELPLQLVAHEQVHCDRQLIMGVEKWWEQYVSDVKFRFDEELLAHRAEYEYLSKHSTNRHARRSNLTIVADRLASGMYGNMVSKSEAKKLLTK